MYIKTGGHIFILIFFIGCAATLPQIQAIDTSSLDYAIKDVESKTKSGILSESKQSQVVLERLRTIKALENEYIDHVAVIREKQQFLTKKSYQYGNFRLGWVLTGVAIGAASAVSAVVWPAWVSAGLGATAGGLITIQASYDEEGFTKEGVDNALKELNNDAKEPVEAFPLAIRKAILNVNAKDDRQYRADIEKASNIIGKLKFVALKEYIPKKIQIQNSNSQSDSENKTTQAK